MRKILSIICAIVMMCVCVACGDSESSGFSETSSKSVDETAENAEKNLIGTWEYDYEESDVKTNSKELTFFEGGGLANSGETGSWSVSGSTISILGTYGGQFFKHDDIMGEFKVQGDKLIISNPSIGGDIERGNLVYVKFVEQEVNYEELIESDEYKQYLEKAEFQTSWSRASTIFKYANSVLETFEEDYKIDTTKFDGVQVYIPNDISSNVDNDLLRCMNDYYYETYGNEIYNEEFALVIENGVCVCSAIKFGNIYGTCPYVYKDMEMYNEYNPTDIYSAISDAKEKLYNY